MKRPYHWRSLLVLGVYPHDESSFPVPVASLTLYTSLPVHSAVLEIVR